MEPGVNYTEFGIQVSLCISVCVLQRYLLVVKVGLSHAQIGLP